MKHIKLFENFVLETAYSEKIKDLGQKAVDLANKKAELTNKVKELTSSADTPKEAVKAEIGRVQLQILDLDRQKLLLSKRMADLNQKLKNLSESNVIIESEETYTDYPAAATKNAQMAIDWKEKYGRDEVTAGTPVGWARAHQLANKEPLSIDTINRMSAFNRHRKNSKIDPEFKDTPWKDKGYVAWLIWGGDEGVDWAMKKAEELRSEE